MAARCWKRRKSAELRTLLSILLSVRLTMTSSDETVYELFVPVDKPEVLPQTISILAEFSSEIWISSDDLEKERGAVLEEYRGTRNANGRMQEAHWALMMEGYKGSATWFSEREIAIARAFLLSEIESAYLERDQMQSTSLRDEYLQLSDVVDSMEVNIQNEESVTTEEILGHAKDRTKDQRHGYIVLYLRV
ncbi:hypothetical protein AgCh_018750 [Apium graveolens]